jgi:hypothetical protein
MSPQSLPWASQRIQRKPNVIGWSPDQLPRLASRRLPGAGVPEMVGRDVFTGAPLVLCGWTTAVGFEAATVEPSAFDAVTRKRIRNPVSAPRMR